MAELYLGFPPTSGAPARALRGFARVHLLPGENRHLSYTLKARDLSMVNEQGEHVVAPGVYTEGGGWRPTRRYCGEASVRRWRLREN